MNSPTFKFFTTLLILCTLCLAPTTYADDNTLEHIVIVWLKDPGNAEHREKIISASEILKTIPGVLSLKIGSMMPSDRAIIDSSFDVALIVSFTDPAALQAYVTHPTHIKLVEETLKPLVKEIRVYDIQ